MRGESSPSYTTHPFYPGVPARIREVIPDVRMLYLVRDPIERIVSHYMYRLLTHAELGSLEETLDDPAHGPWLIGLSRYWLQLEQYLAWFPSEQILVVDSDDLRARRPETLSHIFRFLEIDPEVSSDGFGDEQNEGRRVRRSRAGVTIVKGLYRALGPRTAHAVVSRAPAALKAPFSRPIERAVVGERLRERLAAELGGDVERLRAHTGLALAGWSL